MHHSYLLPESELGRRHERGTVANVSREPAGSRYCAPIRSNLILLVGPEESARGAAGA